MFGPIGPHLKGGFNRVQQAVLAAYHVLKGPPESDFLVSAGDRPYEPISTPFAGRTLLLRGGQVPGPGSATVSAAGGAVQIRGADGYKDLAGANTSPGGTVLIQPGDTNATNNGSASDVTVQGGTHTSSSNVTAGKAIVIGGTGTNGGAVNITGGVSNGASGGIAGDVNITGGTPSTTGAGGNVFIAAGNANTTGAGKHVRLRAGQGLGGTNVDGNVQLDPGRGAAISTTAQGGFVTIPTCAGTPTGTPLAAGVPTGSVPMVWDTTNNILWMYSGGAWRSGTGTSPIGPHQVIVWASSMRPSLSGGCNALAAITTAANQPDIYSLDFAKSVDSYAQFMMPFPKSWNAGTITAQFIWTNLVGTGNVVWAIQGASITDLNSIATAYGTAQTVLDTAVAAASNVYYLSAATAAVTLAGTPTKMDGIFWRVYRNGSNVSDTLNVAAKLLGVIITMTTDAATDV